MSQTARTQIQRVNVFYRQPRVTRISLCYEIWCMKCEKDEEKREDDEVEEKKVREKMKKEMKLYKYIGEKRQSVFERSLEHKMAQQTAT